MCRPTWFSLDIISGFRGWLRGPPLKLWARDFMFSGCYYCVILLSNECWCEVRNVCVSGQKGAGANHLILWEGLLWQGRRCLFTVKSLGVRAGAWVWPAIQRLFGCRLGFHFLLLSGLKPATGVTRTHTSWCFTILKCWLSRWLQGCSFVAWLIRFGMRAIPTEGPWHSCWKLISRRSWCII